MTHVWKLLHTRPTACSHARFRCALAGIKAREEGTRMARERAREKRDGECNSSGAHRVSLSVRVRVTERLLLPGKRLDRPCPVRLLQVRQKRVLLVCAAGRRLRNLRARRWLLGFAALRALRCFMFLLFATHMLMFARRSIRFRTSSNACSGAKPLPSTLFKSNSSEIDQSALLKLF